MLKLTTRNHLNLVQAEELKMIYPRRRTPAPLADGPCATMYRLKAIQKGKQKISDFQQLMHFLVASLVSIVFVYQQWRRKIDKWGRGLIFIYSCFALSISF